MANERFYQGPYWDNLGIALASGVFTVQGALGRSLSSANPAYVVLPSASTPGEFVKYTVTADQSFIDDVGSSEIIDNLFGATTGVAWANALPFFLYAVGNDAETAVAFMLCRRPHITVSPAAANIGAPDDAVADAEGDFWSIDNIDESLYDANPCMCIGSFRMTMTTSDDWTVQAIDAEIDGIGAFQENNLLTYVVAQNGAAAANFLIANGGTAPTFSTLQMFYKIEKAGYATVFMNFRNDGGGDGASAVGGQIALPYTVLDVGSSNDYFAVSFLYNSVGTGAAMGIFSFVEAANHVSLQTQAGAGVTWDQFTNGGRYILASFRYAIDK